MSSFQSISNFASNSLKRKDSRGKPKPAVKPTVKPILKKWSQSGKKKRSADLDREWDQQEKGYRSTQDWGRSSSISFYDQTAAVGSGAGAGGYYGGGVEGGVVGGGRSGGGGGDGGRVTPSIMEGAGVGPGVLQGGTTTTRRYNHSRSISGTSHVSVATSNSSNGVSGPRQVGATFVHPFQQTPHTSTPPLLSYANSLASIADIRDYSPTTITEDDDNDDEFYHNNSTTNYINRSTHYVHQVHQVHPMKHNPSSLSQPTLGVHRQLQTSQPTSSFTDIPNSHPARPPPPQPPLRINTSRTLSSVPTHSSGLIHVSSRSDLYPDCIVDSPSSSNLPSATIASPSSTMAPMSPLRVSLDSGFRLRAKSDLDTATRAEHLRAARQKFEMKERAKDEKYAREEIKRRERDDNKRAQELDRQLAAHHKEQLAAKARQEAAELDEALKRAKHNRKISAASSGRPSLAIPRPSIALSRPSMSRKNTSGQMGESEKFMSNSNDSTDPHSDPYSGPPRVGEPPIGMDANFATPKRKFTAKKKTRSAWTAFILWLRTKLLRMGKT